MQQQYCVAVGDFTCWGSSWNQHSQLGQQQAAPLAVHNRSQCLLQQLQHKQATCKMPSRGQLRAKQAVGWVRLSVATCGAAPAVHQLSSTSPTGCWSALHRLTSTWAHCMTTGRQQWPGKMHSYKTALAPMRAAQGALGSPLRECCCYEPVCKHGCCIGMAELRRIHHAGVHPNCC